jgi:quercetin dioxygenase-like cupin family protein
MELAIAVLDVRLDASSSSVWRKDVGSPKSAANNLYEVASLTHHLVRSRFRITELTITPAQKVPWHCHSKVQDTFYILEGQVRIFLRDPKEEVTLPPGTTCSVRPGRPHLVTNGGERNATFLVLQGIGEYDFIALDRVDTADLKDAKALLEELSR